MIRRRIQTIVALFAITAFAAWTAVGRAEARLAFEPSGGGPQQGDNCSACHQKNGDQTVSLFARSTHARSGITCNRCHGGDPFATEKQAAHGGRFVGKPSSNDTLAMCGSCHRAQLAAFKTSRHFPERRGVARVDCSGCHGAHLVGAQSTNFSFGYYCAGCHGLEYLPELPTDFQKMLAVADESRKITRAIEEAGRKPSDEVASRRKEIRRLISEIVHPTNLQVGHEKIAEIIRLGEELKQIEEQEKRKQVR
ncbi:MAG TPA: multiheme c-type cytochrome [Blastocatellia bacterium]|nr:multiheme c-type cytochrome [Blastocatellia bacterium]